MEGPPLKVIAEKFFPFRGKTIASVSGNTKIEKEILTGEKVLDIKTRGKLLFLVFSRFSLKVHFLMFGSYRINEEREGMTARLALVFEKGKINLYNCSVQFIANEDIDEFYPSDIDILSSDWSVNKILKLASLKKSEYICDLLLDQSVFAGVGNIIKNEALFLAKIHPHSVVKFIPLSRMKELGKRTREFSCLFYEKSKKSEPLRPELRIYNKRLCPVCKTPIRRQKTGKLQRVSYACAKCQELFS